MLMAAASIMIGLRRVQLTVFGDNDPAIKLYRRFGFEIEGRHRDFVRRGASFVDALTMAKLYDAREAATPNFEALAGIGPARQSRLGEAGREARAAR
jgi:hypothetical protein